MHFTAETSANDVVERRFTLDEISGVLWSPASGSDGAPVILMGHGGGLHKTAPGVVARAHYYVTNCGFTVAAIDAPGHGDRPRNAQDERWVAAFQQARAAGEPIGPIVVDYNTSLAERAVPEWQATINALQALPDIGVQAPIGYGGAALATAIGVQLAAIDPRITAAVFGGVPESEAITKAAKQITIPIQFLLPWDDEVIDRQSGIALFDAFASKEKTLHANVGGHHEVPWFEVEDSARFYLRHLSRVGTAPA